MKLGTKNTGLGDILLLTSICKYFPNQFTVEISDKKKHYECIFSNLAKVIFNKEENITETENLGNTGHWATRKLRNYFGPIADYMDNRPMVLYSDFESEKWAYEFLLDKCNPVIFVPTCSKRWAKTRDIPDNIVDNILEHFAKNKITPIICQSSQNIKNIDGINLIDLDLKKYICLLRMVGIYHGANTGDEHLATAVGCRTFVHQPQDSDSFCRREWNYSNLNSTYFIWNDYYKS